MQSMYAYICSMGDNIFALYKELLHLYIAKAVHKIQATHANFVHPLQYGHSTPTVHPVWVT